MSGEAGAAPIPAPRDGAEYVGGAAPGPGCRETGSTARSGVCRAASGGGVSFYADVHRTKRSGEGFRITYTTDGESFRYADGFGDLPAGSGDRVFVDALPVQDTDGALELMRRGAELYYLRRLTLIKKRREELRLSKTTRNDLRALMSIEEKWFRRVTEDFLVMRRMILAYRSLLKTHQQLLNKYNALSNVERSVLKPAIKALEEQMDEMARKISEEAGKRYPVYVKLVEELGIGESGSAKEALAELVTYIDLEKGGLRGLKKLLGLYKPVPSRRRRHWRLYNGRLRLALNRLAVAHYRAIPNGKQCWQLIRRVKQLSMTQTPG